MADASREGLALRSSSATILGGATAVAGLSLTAAYPLDVLTRPGTGLVEAPRATHPFLIYPTLILGPLLLTLGTVALCREVDGRLTPRRALLAPLTYVLGAAAGIAAYVYRWLRVTPTTVPSDTGGPPRTIYFTPIELVQREFTPAHQLSLVAVTAVVVGAITATHGRRAGLLGGLPLVALVALMFLEQWRLRYGDPALLLTFAVGMPSIPFLVGYVIARRSAEEASEEVEAA